MIETTASLDHAALPDRLRRAFRELLPLPLNMEAQLGAALRETLSRPGSLVRAELAFQVGAAYSLREADAEALSIALEYFHTASLLFDDLPSMDDAFHRRGAVCIHQLFGEGTAILSALALINRAYSLTWSAMTDLPADRRRLAAEYLERYLGLRGILDGQSRDIHFGRPGAAPQSPQQIALEKTASLIRLPLVLPAILGGAPALEQHLLHRLAKFWGLGYQALDDLKDVLRERGETGKTSRRDELLRRPNVALELGPEATVVRLQRLDSLAARTLRRLESSNPALTFLNAVSLRFEAETRATLQDVQGTACCF